MTLSSTLSNAFSGMTANARNAAVISANVSNAQTPGYGPRSLSLASDGFGGVRVTGTLRSVDLGLLNDLRVADAGAAGTDAVAGFFRTLETTIGDPTEAGSLGGRVASLQSALILAGTEPSSEAALSGVLGAAQDLAGQINTISDQIQSARSTADQTIASDVDALNTALQQVSDLNSRITAQIFSNRDASSLMDQRQQIIDGIAEIVPLRQIPRENGQVALLTATGTTLLDGTQPAEITFSPTRQITPDMTLASGALSGLAVNGIPVSTDPERGAFAGGTLAANFEIRDSLAPEAQGRIDSIARALIERFSDSGTDPTLSAGMPGLFTDAAATLDPTQETGLAGRLAVNALADPDRGGTLATLRNGFGASSPAASGDGSMLDAMRDALTGITTPASGDLVSGGSDIAGLSSAFLSLTGSARLSAESVASYSATRADALRGTALEDGVDTDQQMQQLLVVEQAYAANARVIQAVDEMMQTILGI